MDSKGAVGARDSKKQLPHCTGGSGFTSNQRSNKKDSAALGNNFVEQFWGAAFGSRSSFEEQLCAAISNRNFEKSHLWGAILGTNFSKQLWGAAVSSNFAEQLSGAAEQVWSIAALGQPLCVSGTPLGKQLREPLWGAALGSSFVESNFVESSFGEEE